MWRDVRETHLFGARAVDQFGSRQRDLCAAYINCPARLGVAIVEGAICERGYHIGALDGTALSGIGGALVEGAILHSEKTEVLEA